MTAPAFVVLVKAALDNHPWMPPQAPAGSWWTGPEGVLVQVQEDGTVRELVSCQNRSGRGGEVSR